MKKGIFISYCHSDKQFTDDFIENIMKVIPDVKFDKSILFGNDFAAFEKTIKDNIYQAILVLCTPEYKRRADDDKNVTGVSREVEMYKVFLKEPNQNYVIPIILKGDSESSLPNVFKNQIMTSYVNLSRIDILDTDPSRKDIINDEFTKLVNILQGIYPRQTMLSELEAAIHYISAELPALNDTISTNFKRDLTNRIVELCEQAHNTLLNLGSWLNLSSEIKAMEAALNKMPTEKLLEYPNAIIKLLIFLSKWYDYIGGKNEKAFETITKAIEIAQSDKTDKYYKLREHELLFQKAITLHKLDRLEEALTIYISLLREDLNPRIAFNAGIYAGHIYSLHENFEEADKFYNIVVEEFENNVPLFIPPHLYKELELLRNHAIYSIHNKTPKHDKIIEDYKKKEFNANMNFNPLYPPTLALPVRLKKPPVVFNYDKTSLND